MKIPVISADPKKQRQFAIRVLYSYKRITHVGEYPVNWETVIEIPGLSDKEVRGIVTIIHNNSWIALDGVEDVEQAAKLLQQISKRDS